MNLGRGTDKNVISCRKSKVADHLKAGLWTDRLIDRQTDQHPLMWQISKLLVLTFSLVVVSAVAAAPDFAVVIAAAVVAVAVVVAVDGAGVIRLFPVVLKRPTSDFRLPNHKLLLLPQQQLLRQLCQQSQQRESSGMQQQES